MIGVAVGVNGGIQAGDAGAEGLGAEIGGGIDVTTQTKFSPSNMPLKVPITGRLIFRLVRAE